MRCFNPCTGPAVARWEFRIGGEIVLCQGCLDGWFDIADDDEMLEPVAWSWLSERAAA